MSDTMTCPGCGTTLPAAAAFCTNCGKALHGSAAVFEAATPSEPAQPFQDFDENQTFDALDQAFKSLRGGFRRLLDLAGQVFDSRAQRLQLLVERGDDVVQNRFDVRSNGKTSRKPANLAMLKVLTYRQRPEFWRLRPCWKRNSCRS